MFLGEATKLSQVSIERVLIQMSRDEFLLNQQPLSLEALSRYLCLILSQESIEYVYVFFVDREGLLVAEHVHTDGLAHFCTLNGRKLLRSALDASAYGVWIAHNHPSGSPSPSQADRLLTQSVKEILATIDVTLLDSLVIGDNLVFSINSGTIVTL
jgi:DNA repair protein RadC